MRFVLYNHVGSANHGCEALVRTISEMLGENQTVVLSDAPQEEIKYGIDQKIRVYPSMLQKKIPCLDFLQAYMKLKINGNYFYMDILPYKAAIRNLDSEDILVSIGGDIFCYENYPKYNLLHQYALKYVKHSILLGCSIEPDLLKEKKLLDDLRSFELITARESITFQVLKDAGLENIVYCPDSAFGLKAVETELPKHFKVGNTIGINISPLILNKAENSQVIMENLRVVIRTILKNSESAVALIPHVAWDNNNDSVPLKLLYEEFKYSKRICLVEDQDAQRLKWIISQCSYFIGARTHATIAAYSTGVPTLVLGYSVKSKGIARDLFGTETNYVLPYQTIQKDDDVQQAFEWIQGNSKKIQTQLMRKCKEYQAIINEISKKILGAYER